MEDAARRIMEKGGVDEQKLRRRYSQRLVER
jgi:hypothetical protein